MPGHAPFFCPAPPEYVTSDKKAQDSTDVTRWFVDRWEQYRANRDSERVPGASAGVVYLVVRGGCTGCI